MEETSIGALQATKGYKQHHNSAFPAIPYIWSIYPGSNQHTFRCRRFESVPISVFVGSANQLRRKGSEVLLTSQTIEYQFSEYV